MFDVKIYEKSTDSDDPMFAPIDLEKIDSLLHREKVGDGYMKFLWVPIIREKTLYLAFLFK